LAFFLPSLILPQVTGKAALSEPLPRLMSTKRTNIRSEIKMR
jgi:hypothetical protein